MAAHSSFETSAGGLVIRRIGGRPEAAVIGRLSARGRLRWSLPKGHVEAGETLAETAVREVQEETGILGAVVTKLGSFRYSFQADGRRIHKRVHHFLLRALSGELSDEDIEVAEVAWVPVTDLDGRLAYVAERRLVHRAMDLLHTLDEDA